MTSYSRKLPRKVSRRLAATSVALVTLTLGCGDFDLSWLTELRERPGHKGDARDRDGGVHPWDPEDEDVDGSIDGDSGAFGEPPADGGDGQADAGAVLVTDGGSAMDAQAVVDGSALPDANWGLDASLEWDADSGRDASGLWDGGQAADAAILEDAAIGDERDPAAELQGWFVDSIRGDDRNDGRTELTPLATLSRLLSAPLTSADVIHLARGSLWREELTGLPRGSVVRAYGQGPRPIIDGSDVAANVNFAKSETWENLYEIEWTHEFGPDGGKSAHRVWEDGVRLRRMPDFESCNATPGSFFAAAPTSGGPDLVYVHASGGSDVRTNGRTYELTRRRWALQLYEYRDHAEVYSVHTRRNAYADGSLVVDGLISDCLAEDGRIHNVFIRGVAEDTTAWKIEPPTVYGGATMFVTYEDKEDLPGVVYRGCKAIADGDALGPNGGANKGLTLGFYGHTSAGKMFGTAIYEECSASGVAQGFGFQQVNEALYYRCSTEGGRLAVSSYPEKRLAVLGGVYRTAGVNASLIRYSSDYGRPDSIVLRGVRSITEGTHTQPLWINRADGVTEITRCSFTLEGGGMFRFAAGSFDVRNNIFTGNNFELHVSSATAAYLADFNLYFNTRLVPVTFRLDGAGISGLQPWQVTTNQDSNSLEADPIFLGTPRLGEFDVADGSPVWDVAAGADYEGEENDMVLQSYRQSFSVAP